MVDRGGACEKFLNRTKTWCRPAPAGPLTHQFLVGCRWYDVRVCPCYHVCPRMAYYGLWLGGLKLAQCRTDLNSHSGLKLRSEFKGLRLPANDYCGTKLELPQIVPA